MTVAPETLFYDGDCGLCHGAVTFVLNRDRAGAFRFAPLAGDTFRTRVDEATRRTLPDSLVLMTRDGRMLTRSAAVLHIMRRLGGMWGAAATVSSLVPAAMRDWTYDRIAAIRHRLFAKPQTVCPIGPPEWMRRFDP